MLTIGSLRAPAIVWSGKDLLEELVIAIVLGTIIGIATRLYETERLPYRFIVTIHFMIVTTGVFVAGAIGNWYDYKDITSILLVFVVVVIVYVIIWVVFTILEKKEIEKVNELLKRKKGME